MAVVVSPAQQALFDSSVVVPVFLVKLDLRTQAQYLTNWPLQIDALGQSFQGLGQLGEVGPLKESEDGAEEKITLTLSAVNNSLLAGFLGSVSEYQDREVSIWLLMLNKDTLQPSEAPVLRFSGLMDQVGVIRGEEESKITLDCRTGGYAPRNNPSTLRLNDVQHRERHPGELGLSFVQSLIDVPTVWASKKFQSTLY
jgi:hypothetical protein